MNAPDDLWIIIIGLAVGSFCLRFSFLGLIGDRPLPPWILRHLRYTAVAVLPALIAPMVVWPEATGGQPDPARFIAALVTFGTGLFTRSILIAILAGGSTLYLALSLLG